MKASQLLKDKLYIEYIHDLLTEKTLSLEEIIHHKNTTRLRHCLSVSYRNYRICRFLNLDAKAAARAGLLHDYFFYDRKEFNKNNKGVGHMRSHPAAALANASDSFELTEKEADIILSHMWPVTLKRPRFAESVVIIIVDKYCAVLELLGMMKNKNRL